MWPRSRRLASALALTALAAGVLVVAGPAGPAAAATGQIQVAASTYTKIILVRRADGSSTWKTQTVATGEYGQAALAQESNGNTVIAAVQLVGADRGTLYYFWEASGSSTWHRQQVSGIGAVAPLVPPSIAAQAQLTSGESINTEIVAQNASGVGSTLYWQTVGTSPWDTEAVPTVTGTATGPFISVDSDNTTVVGYTSSNGFGLDRQKYGTTTSWETEQTVYPGLVMTSVQAMDEADGRIVVAATDSAGSIYFFYNSTGKVGDWYQQSLPFYAQGGVTLVANAKEKDVTLGSWDALSPSGEWLSAYTEADGSTSWHEDLDFAAPGWDGETLDVALAAQPDGDLQLAAMASNQTIQLYTKPPGGSWSDDQLPPIVDTFYALGLTAD